MTELKAVKLSISGKVQGVGFRDWVLDQAQSLALDGWVRNRKDGTVDALFSGESAAVDAMIQKCHQGPEASHVESVTVEPALGITPKGFVRKPTV